MNEPPISTSGNRESQPVAGAGGWAPGATVLGEFRVEKLLGKGGFGQVVLVQNRRSGERYAVKRILLGDSVARGQFLEEAQRWVNLPEHPHIVSCYFIRAVGDEVAIFAEYVGGGSLAEWIGSARLHENGGRTSLTRILRIAVQCAWALHAAHRMGVTHLDMKPSNVLMTGEGLAKITDFGLAAVARAPVPDVVAMEHILDYIVGIEGLSDEERELMKDAFRRQVLAPSEGESFSVPRSEAFSAAYASPEQVEGKELTLASDLWSWAATVLEMFVGRRTWPSGPLAVLALQEFEDRAEASGSVVLPRPVADLLRSCFERDPRNRPASLGDVADILSALHRAECGESLENERPPEVPLVAQTGQARRIGTGARWSDPRRVLGFAYEAAGLNPDDAVRFWPSGLGTPKAQAVEDLRSLSEARRVLEEAASAGSDDVLLGLGSVIGDMARVRISLGDASGAIGDYEAVVRVLAGVPGDDAVVSTVICLTGLAVVLREQGRVEESLRASRRAIELARGLSSDVDGNVKLLADALLSEANTATGAEGRARLYDEALSLYEAVEDGEGTYKALAAKASVLGPQLGANEAEVLWERAEAAHDRLNQGSLHLLEIRAATLMNRAMASAAPVDILRWAQAAVDDYTVLVSERGHYLLAGNLGVALFYLGMGYEHTDRPQQAWKAYERSRELLEEAVVRDGRSDLTDELARSFDYESTLARDLGDPSAAVEVASRAVALWRRLADLDGQELWANELARAHTKLAAALSAAGDRTAAGVELGIAVELAQQTAETASSRSRLTLAAALHERGILRRSVGDPEGAIENYRATLDLLEDAGPRNEQTLRARTLQNLSNALEDKGDYEAATALIGVAIAAWQALVEQGELVTSNVIDAAHNRVNKLIKLGDYHAAHNFALTTLADYRGLVERGRTDLIADMARLKGADALTLERLFDVNGAIGANEAAIGLFSQAQAMDPEMRELVLSSLRERRDRLIELAGATRDDVAGWLRAAQQALEAGALLWQQRRGVEACAAIEDAIGWLMSLAAAHPNAVIQDLCGSLCLHLGVLGLSSGRIEAARRGFHLSIECYDSVLRERGADAADAWANANRGLASLLKFTGDDVAAEDVISRAAARLAKLNKRKYAQWSSEARAALADMARR